MSEWKIYSTYRRIPIYRRVTPRDVYPRRSGFEYLAEAKGIEIRTRSIQSVKIQIGRVMNGLDPSDCGICRYHVVATPVRLDYCEMACKEVIEKARGSVCPCFQTR